MLKTGGLPQRMQSVITTLQTASTVWKLLPKLIDKGEAKNLVTSLEKYPPILIQLDQFSFVKVSVRVFLDKTFNRILYSQRTRENATTF